MSSSSPFAILGLLTLLAPFAVAVPRTFNPSAHNATGFDNVQIAISSPSHSFVNYDGCAPEDNPKVDQALAQFKPIARGAYQWYLAKDLANAPQATRQLAARTHSDWFGNLAGTRPAYQRMNAILIEQVYKNAVNGRNDNPNDAQSARLDFWCTGFLGSENCVVGDFARTPSTGRKITLCPGFFTNTPLDWRLLKRQPKERLAAGTIAHEITHSKFLTGVFDDANQVWTNDVVGYGWDNCRNAALAADPEDAIRNADNYKFYFQRAFYAYCQCSDWEGTRLNQPAGSQKAAICHDFWAAVPAESSGGCEIL